MKGNPTIIDIAKLSGFSKSTVSKVLRNERYVKKQTKKEIEKAINELGYQPDEIARSLVLKKNINLIGVIISDITNPYFSEVVLGIEAEAKKRNCNVILCNTNYSEKEEQYYIDILCRYRVLGLILATPTISDNNIKQLLDKKYPFILITRKVKGIETNFVSIDHFKSAKMATNYLIQRGHKKIAHFTGFENIYGLIKRLEGYKSALKDSNIEVKSNYIIKNEISIEGGYKSAKTLLEMEDKPTAIFASDDFIAIGAKDYFVSTGYKVPEDFSILGFNDINITGLKSINLTTVYQPKFDLGTKSVKILFKQLKNPDKFKIIKEILESKIIERDSVCSINN